ncbi:MAG: amino acid ABC transporter permease [Pseudomonadota bacterium]
MSDKQIAFVASGQIPESPPPPSTTGVIGWLRENLFSSITNSILTILAIGLIVLMIPGIIQWAFVDGVWIASSLKECREINAHGACWAVIVERFDQFIYGFYPSDERWRPNLAFILLLVALVPALFDNVPYRGAGLMFSASYPIIAYWLIWGGSFWGIVAFAAAFVVAYGVFQAVSKIFEGEGATIGLILGLVAAVVWMLVAIDPVADTIHDAIPLGLEPVASNKLGGFLLATIIGIAGIVLSLPIGIVLALGRRSSMPYIQTVCIVFIEFIRGVPLITLLFVANVVLNYFFPPGSNLDLILRVVIMVTLFSSAYMAEVIRGGLAALPQGQYEAADSLGLDYWKSMRLIIMPQALKISIPNIVSSFIGLFKDTTLVVVIGLLDPVGLIGTTRADSAWNGIIWEFYVFVGLFFFVVCFGMSRYSMYLERKLKTDR